MSNCAHVCHGGTHNQIADENLQNLGLQALAPLEDLLEKTNQDVAEGCADQCTVDGHLGDARGEVMARLAPVVRDPRREELLETGEGARSEHLGAQRVALELLEIGLGRRLLAFGAADASMARNSLQDSRWARRPW